MGQNLKNSLLNAQGVYAIATTPFLDNGDIDFNSVDKLSEYYLESGSKGITILGVMGEAPKMNLEEQKYLVQRYVKNLRDKIPIIIGVSNPGLDNLKNIAQEGMQLGANGVMVAGLNGLKNDDQIENYFDSVVRYLEGVPICLQDYPPTTNVHFSVSSIEKIFAKHPQFEMFKHEDCPGHRKLTQLIKSRGNLEREKYSILVGNGGLYVPQELFRGADGIMTGFAFTSMLVNVYDLFQKGSREESEDLFDIYLPLIRHEQQFGIGLALRKEVLKKMGIISSSKTRSPGPKLDKDDLEELDRLLSRLKKNLEIKNLSVPIGI